MRRPWLLSGLFLGLALGSSAAEITGRAVNDGRGVVGATVTAVPYESPYAAALRQTRGEPDPSPIAVAATGTEGRFKLEIPRNSPAFVVRVAFGGLASRTVEGVFEGGDSEELAEISLPPGETVSGRVVDQLGKPVAGARVRMGRDGAIATTNRDGLFRLDDLALRSGRPLLGSLQRLSVEAAGFEVQPVARPRSGVPLAVKLKPSSQRVIGTLRDWSGKSAVEAVLRLVGDVVTSWVRADPGGHFEIPGAPSKAARLQALGKDGSSLELAITPGAANSIFTLGRGASIEGRVVRTDDGKPVQGVKVTAESEEGTIRARTGTDGRYRLSALPQGAYRVTFDEPRFVLVNRRGVELGAGEVKPMDVALTPSVTLTGRVSDEKGQPVKGAHGSLSPGNESRVGFMMRGVRPDGAPAPAFTSGADGTFKASRLAPGTNQKLTVTHPDFETRVIPGVDLVAGAPQPPSLEIVLSPGLSLSGIVKDKEGQPIADAEVTLSRAFTLTGRGGGNAFSFSTVANRPQVQTDYEGRFGFKGLSEGEYSLTVSKTGFTRSVSNRLVVGKGTASLEVVLNPGASISGRLVQTNGLPATGYSVLTRLSSGPPTGGTFMIGERGSEAGPVDPDGAFTVEGLTPGSAYDLLLVGLGERPDEPKKKNVVAPSSDVEIEVATRGRIAGRVVDAASGAPVTDFEASYAPARGGGRGGIVVRIGPNESERRIPFSSPEGAFVFDDVPPGNWDVSVWAKTYQDARTAGIVVGAGETKTVEVKAARGLVIRGRVMDTKTGRGVPDASVTAREDGGNGRGGLVFATGGPGSEAGGVISDADGYFEIGGKGPGAYQLTARHSLYSEGTARVTLEDKDTVAEIPLLSGGTIAGVVISSQGAPLPGAQVSLDSSGDGGMRFGLDDQNALTDGGGRFRFEHLPAARYKVGASLREESSPMVDVPLNVGDIREDIRLVLDAGVTVRGVVSGLGEVERAGVMVGAQGAQNYFGNTRTNSDGSFEFTGVPKGALTLRATAGDLLAGLTHTAVKELLVSDGAPELTTEIVFEDGLSISGTVRRGGEPVAGARVSAFNSGTGGQASARADEAGAFKISGLTAGRIGLVAFGDGFQSRASQVVELKADTTVDLEIPIGRLAGGVFDASSGLPLEASVELQLPSSSTPGGFSRLEAVTDSAGRFSFDNLDTVDSKITARRSGYESLTSTVKPSETGEEVRLELNRGSGLAIEARDAQMGFGLRSLFVRARQGAIEAFSGNVALDGEGRGEIPGLPAGAYSVVAQAPGYAPVSAASVIAPSATLRLSFTPGGAVEFRTTEDFLSGGPKTGQLISLGGGTVGLGPGGPGSFRLSRLNQQVENLAPGRYRLTLEGGVDKTFDITEGGVSVVTIP